MPVTTTGNGLTDCPTDTARSISTTGHTSKAISTTARSPVRMASTSSQTGPSKGAMLSRGRCRASGSISIGIGVSDTKATGRMISPMGKGSSPMPMGPTMRGSSSMDSSGMKTGPTAGKTERYTRGSSEMGTWRARANSTGQKAKGSTSVNSPEI